MTRFETIRFITTIVDRQISADYYSFRALKKPSCISSQLTANDDLEYGWLESFLSQELGFAYSLTVCPFNIFSPSQGRLVTAQSLYKEGGGNRNCRASQFPLSGIREFPPTLIVPFPNTARV